MTESSISDYEINNKIAEFSQTRGAALIKKNSAKTLKSSKKAKNLLSILLRSVNIPHKMIKPKTKIL